MVGYIYIKESILFSSSSDEMVMADLEPTNERATNETQCEAENLTSDCHTAGCDQGESDTLTMESGSRMTPILEVKLATKEKEVS